MLSADQLGHRSSFLIGKLTVAPSCGELFGPDGRQHVEPRVMQVLVALADADGSTVTRGDLMSLCWNGRVVGDDALNRVIAVIRKMVRNVGPGDVRLTSIPKIGYRLTVCE